MSGYFARLAAQVASPGVTTGARATANPPSLEQHDEVSAPMVASTAPPLNWSEERQPLSLPEALPKAQATLEAGPMARPPERRTDAPAGALPLPGAMTRPDHVPPSTSALTSPLAQSQNEVSADHALPPPTKAQANTRSSSLRQARDMPLPQVAPQLRKEPPSLLASPSGPDLPRPRSAHQEPGQNLAGQPPAQAASLGSSSFTARPVQPDHHRAPAPTMKPSNPGEAMPRTQISIGTITLEVRAANPAPVNTPAPPPAAEPPAQVPTRFALRRHHVRWS